MGYESDWYQQVLVEPDVLEATIRVGVIAAQDHAQTYWEVKDPTNGVLLAAGSVHHCGMHGLAAAVERAVEKALGALGDHCSPF